MDSAHLQQFIDFIGKIHPIDNDLQTQGNAFFCEPKNNEKSTEFRNEGNKYYKKSTVKDILLALRLYNKSICFAKENSEELSMAYSNRSAAFFSIEEYEICLENIEMSRRNGIFSQNLTEKLMKRETRCQEKLISKNQSVSKYPIEPKLSYPCHSTIPFIAECLELRNNGQYGRHIITNRDLKVGDIVAIEEPFCTIVPNSKRYERCEHCFAENSMNLVPCKGCTLTMFCNEKCYQQAYELYHKFECNVIDYIDKKLSDRLDFIPMRMTLCAIAMFPTVSDLISFLNDSEGKNNNVFTIDYKTNVNPSKIYGPIYSMQKSDWGAVAEHASQFQKLNSILIAMMKRTDLYTYLNGESIDVIIKLQRHHIRVTAVNASATWDMADNSESDLETINTGIFPFRSLLSHSCVPNIWTTAWGSKVIVSILRPIKAGQQLFDSYGCCHIGSPLNVRRQVLSFVCDCIACKEDWPMDVDLPDGPIPQPVLTKDPTLFIDIYDRDIVEPNFNNVVNYLQSNDKHYPCKQLITTQNIYAHLLDLMYGSEIPLCVRFNPPHQLFSL